MLTTPFGRTVILLLCINMKIHYDSSYHLKHLAYNYRLLCCGCWGWVDVVNRFIKVQKVSVATQNSDGLGLQGDGCHPKIL